MKCKFCNGENLRKNGITRGKQRYLCRECKKNQVEGDERLVYPAFLKQLAVTMYVNNCGFRAIGRILEIPFQYVQNWVKKAGEIIEDLIKERLKEERGKPIQILEIDELHTYIKKNRSHTGLACL